jgi:hypothetical protein
MELKVRGGMELEKVGQLPINKAGKKPRLSHLATRLGMRNDDTFERG